MWRRRVSWRHRGVRGSKKCSLLTSHMSPYGEKIIAPGVAINNYLAGQLDAFSFHKIMINESRQLFCRGEKND